MEAYKVIPVPKPVPEILAAQLTPRNTVDMLYWIENFEFPNVSVSACFSNGRFGLKFQYAETHMFAVPGNWIMVNTTDRKIWFLSDAALRSAYTFENNE